MPMHVLFNNRGNLKQPGPTWGVNNPKEKSRRVGGGQSLQSGPQMLECV